MFLLESFMLEKEKKVDWLTLTLKIHSLGFLKIMNELVIIMSMSGGIVAKNMKDIGVRAKSMDSEPIHIKKEKSM